MLNPDFSKYSLVLEKNQEILFSSAKSGIRPLVECVLRIREKECMLHDKVVGLASARIILYSGKISKVNTLLSSIPAEKLLGSAGIEILSQKTVRHIQNKEGTSICPMEELAGKITDNEAFFKQVCAILKIPIV